MCSQSRLKKWEQGFAGNRKEGDMEKWELIVKQFFDVGEVKRLFQQQQKMDILWHAFVS